MTRSALAFPALVAALLATPVFAQDAPQADQGPLDAVHALFDAMAAHDVAAARKLMLPGTKFIVARGDGTTRVADDAEFLDMLGKDTQAKWQERIWDPQVQVDGPMAQVWAPYDFHLDGTLSHCGTDLFTLVHGAAGWQVAAIAYTMRKDGCAAGG
jgi:hypothetical protein